MKEFWLAILKNIITYVVIICILIVGGITIVTQKFPPDWGQIRSAVITIKEGYLSMIKMRQSMAAPPVMTPALRDHEVSLADVEQAIDGDHESRSKSPKDRAEMQMQTTLALLKSMSQQIQPQNQQAAPVVIDEELKRHVLTLVKQNHEMIERMDKIQTYLAGLNQYLIQTAPRQPIHVSSVQNPPPSRQPSSATQRSITTTSIPVKPTEASPPQPQNAKK